MISRTSLARDDLHLNVPCTLHQQLDLELWVVV
jgi:hypothetical protein